MASIHRLSHTPSSIQHVLTNIVVVYAVYAQRMRVGLSGFRTGLSYVVTVLFFAASIFGFYQIAQIASSEIRTTPTAKLPNTITPGSAVAANMESPQGLPRSAPNRLEIPSLGIASSLVGVAQNDDGSMEVPSHDVAGWYTLAPTPGEIGPAIIVGHVDSMYGPAVFWDLRKAQPGAEVFITREDGKKVTFTVEKVATYDQNNFPSDKVYGNLDYPGLRLITCEGEFDPITRHYSHNLVVYARASNL